MIFKKTIYNTMLDWKENYSNKYSLLIEGARRVGKSTIVKEFASKEYKSYILIDFSIAKKEVRNFFDELDDLNMFFLKLSTYCKTNLYIKNSLIIFDEVQFFPKARQALKYLVQDGRYSYIETGSLISINENVKNILIPSEEKRIEMHPMDYEGTK